MNHTCNFPCYDFRPHADTKYVVCVKCGEIYLKADIATRNYNEAYNMAIDMLENADDTLGIYSALKEAGSQNGITYGPDMQAFVEWAIKKMDLTS